ncbi:hypothetical protein JO972_16555 [Verrucomicrobiaceae bacterium 5K15]|uniref:Uncharacterized protein n=1 Tax=Oceaniferula flava TaxID=2800421 RepID=A0AAE2SEW7_9BACT|nr:hypothetical protein [Oceaniferula flavus]MBK1856583.1 hypothetical protein [Oceaniferula flavus]MBM1137890.1 hypothetical protein [Oceaniferula flavus]
MKIHYLSFEVVLSQYPRLTAEGFVDTDSPKFNASRELLESEGDRVKRVRQWIDKNLNPLLSYSAKINNSRTSYRIKTYAEQELGHIYNGVFIASMLCEGFLIGKESQNVSFNVSNKALRDIEE